VSVTIVDYGIGNLGAIPNMLRRSGVDAFVTSDPGAVASAERLILPGVGAYDAGIRQLRASGLDAVLERKVIGEGVPLLGLCLGMELLSESSEEGDLSGLGWIPGRVVRFRLGPETGKTVPHMGWNTVEPSADDALGAILRGSRYYFAHSYHFEPSDPDSVVGTTTYGYPFASVIRRDNVVGVQFHPEKSHRFGKALLEWFARG
jgi:glutamine amidotransferase